MTELPLDLPSDFAPENVGYRVHLVTGQEITLVEHAGWDELVASRFNDPYVWVRLPSGALLSPRHVVLIETTTTNVPEA